MKNIKLVKNKEADKWFLRNSSYYNKNLIDDKIQNLVKNNNIKANTILEIGSCKRF